MEYLKPSGDVTGVTDHNNIINLLNENKNVLLSEGEFYVNESIDLKENNKICGVSNRLTKLNVVSNVSAFTSDVDTNCNYINVMDVAIVASEPNNNYAINLKGSIQEPYTGASYSIFKNIIIINFESGIFVNHCWNVKFINIRNINVKTNGLFLGGGCNNILCDLIMGNNLTNGIRITTSDIDTTENVNITINNADFEYCNIGVYIYNANNISINDIYTEHCNTVIYTFGCNGFSLNGFYCAYDVNFVETYNYGSIENGYIKVNHDDNYSIINSINNIVMETKNIKVKNDSNGIIFLYKQNMRSEEPIDGDKILYEIESESSRMRYSTDTIQFDFKPYNHVDSQYHCVNPSLIITNDNELTALSSDEFKLYKNGVAEAIVEIHEGDTLNKGKIYKMRKINLDSNHYIYKNGDSIELKHSNTVGVDVELLVQFTGVKIGDYYFS
ncbi:hypothetical protein DXD51_03045 [Eubacterium sp. TM05-53]|nr:hypothetical protein DXD51_03045 [Eubacterium sp. TM05-53]